MDKKKGKSLPVDDIKGFEEFIEGQSGDVSFLQRQPNSKKEVSFEHFTFLMNDAERLVRLKNLLMDKLPFANKYDQSTVLIAEQNKELVNLRKHLFDVCDKDGSPYRKSLSEIFDSFFDPSKP